MIRCSGTSVVQDKLHLLIHTLRPQFVMKPKHLFQEGLLYFFQESGIQNITVSCPHRENETKSLHFVMSILQLIL